MSTKGIARAGAAMIETGTADAVGHGLGARRHRRVMPFVAGSIACVFALVFLAGGAWALWKDRVDRDASGFVTIGSTTLRTGTYAIVGDLHGDGPSWLWGSAVLGDTRVRATSESVRPPFVGIALGALGTWLLVRAIQRERARAWPSDDGEREEHDHGPSPRSAGAIRRAVQRR